MIPSRLASRLLLRIRAAAAANDLALLPSCSSLRLDKRLLTLSSISSASTLQKFATNGQQRGFASSADAAKGNHQLAITSCELQHCWLLLHSCKSIKATHSESHLPGMCRVKLWARPANTLCAYYCLWDDSGGSSQGCAYDV